MEFLLVWTFGYVLNGAPHIRTTQPLPPMSHEECIGTLATDTDRMHDWLRGKLNAPLDFPVAVYGECHPVLKDAAQRLDGNPAGP
jgi:hypothetical protein